MMRSKTYSYLMTLALVALCTMPLRAQQDSAPVGAPVVTAAFPQAQAGTDQTPVETSTPAAGQPSAPVQTMPPISGVQVLNPTFGGSSRNIALPAVACADHANNNPTGIERHASLFSETTCAGSITLQRVGRTTQLNLDDAGGIFFFVPTPPAATDPNVKQYGAFDELGASAVISGRRYKLILGDQGMYVPESPVGFPGFAGLTTFGGGFGGGGGVTAPAFSSALQPNQGIYSGLTSRVSDLAESEFQYVVNAHSIITVSGIFGTLQSLSPGFIDDDSATFMAGYNRYFGRRDIVAVSYIEDHFVFSGGRPGFSTRGASLLYGHTFNPKLSVQLSLAPMANQISLPTGGSLTRFFISTFDSVNYRDGRWHLGVHFSRATSEGAGVLAGAVRNAVSGSAGREFARRYHVTFEGSYTNNESLLTTSTGVNSSTGVSSYNYMQGGLTVSHEFGPRVSMYVNYQAQRQVSNTPICLGASASNCSKVFLRQIGGIGISWHARALNIE